MAGNYEFVYSLLNTPGFEWSAKRFTITLENQELAVTRKDWEW